MILVSVSDDSKGPGGGRYSPLWEQALSCDQWKGSGRGKRGGIRTIYFHHVGPEAIYMLTAYAKADRDDLTAADRKALSRLVAAIKKEERFLTQMCARFSPQQVSHAVERGCGCVRARESAVKSSIAQSTAACAGPAFGGGPARRQPVPPQGAEALAFTGRRTMNTRGTRPGLSPTFYRWAEPSLTVQPLGTGRPLAISAVYRGPDFPRACSSSPDTDGVLQPRKSMTMLDLLAMEPAKAAPIPERNQKR